MAALLVGLVAFAPPSSSAAPGEHRGEAPFVARWSRRSWQTQDGLPDGAIVAITQQPDGTMLVGTTGGSVRFDGVRMLPAANAAAAVSRGSSASTEAVMVSRCMTVDGGAWVGYSNGTVRQFLAGKTVAYGPAEGVTAAKPAHVVADAQGTVWLAQSGQLAEFRAGRFERVADLPAGFVKVAAAPARDGGLWIKVDEPLFYYSREAGLTVRAEHTTGGVSTLFEDSAGRLWLGTDRNGVHVLMGTTVRQVPIAGSLVHVITEDREGGIWVGTATALNRLWPSVAWRCEEGGLRPLRSLCTSAAGDVWGVTLQGEPGRVVIDDRDSGRGPAPIKFFDSTSGWEGKAAESLCADTEDTVWIGCRDGSLYRFTDGRFRQEPSPPVMPGPGDQSIRDILVTRTGTVWACGRAGVFRRAATTGSWDPVRLPTLPESTVKAWGPIGELAEDAAGSIWAATVRGELFRITADGSQAARMTPQQCTGDATVTAICPLDDGSVWVAVRDVGLFRFRGDEVRHLDTGHGLPSVCVLAMTADRGGRLWSICNRRVFAVTIAELDRVADGRQPFCHPWVLSGADDNAFLDAVGDPHCDATVAGDGAVWLTLASGLGVCSPDRLPPSSRVPAAEVEQVRVDGRVVASASGGGTDVWSKRIVIPPDPRTIEILYAPRTFAAPSNVIVERRLHGVDAAWVRGGPGHAATYAGLRAGRYPLHLRTSNDRDEWVNARSPVVLEVQPLLWERTSFRAATIAVAAGLAAAAALGFASYRSRLKMERLERQAALEAERMRIARDMHDEFGTSLTQISLLADLARGDARAPETPHLGDVARIARELVRSMDELVWTVTPTNDTLPHLVSYIGQSASDTLGRFGIACRVRTPGEVPDLPAGADLRRNVLLVVKEAISNVVEHAGAETVDITMDVHDGRLDMTIADDGRGIGPESPTHGGPRGGHGLENMRRRMADLGGTCRIRAVSPHGTAIDVSLPISTPGTELR